MKRSDVKTALDTDVVHGVETSHVSSRDVVEPIHMTSSFKFKDAEHGADLFGGRTEGYVYSRIGNPTVRLLEEKAARLEGGEDAAATASGMAAIAAVLQTLTAPGDNFVSCTTVYGGTFAFFNDHLRRMGVTPRFISPSRGCVRKQVEALVDEKTRLLYMETPANPTLDILSIRVWAAVARRHQIPLVVDNTFATFYLQHPLALGADLTVHSATKYIGGHADAVGGLVIGRQVLIDQIRRRNLHHLGPVMSPFNAWLFLRGLKTLAVRMEKHCANANAVARFLDADPRIERVYYPGLESHPGHGVARKQMRDFGGMLAFEVKGGLAAGKTVMNSVALCTLAVSLGECDTLIQHPASMTHANYSSSERAAAGIGDGLIRVSVGIENADDVIADLDQALARI